MGGLQLGWPPTGMAPTGMASNGDGLPNLGGLLTCSEQAQYEG